MQIKKQELKLDMEPWTGSKFERSTSKLYIVIFFFNLYAYGLMLNARLDEAQTGIKISGRNINNFRYAGDTTLTE